MTTNPVQVFQLNMYKLVASPLLLLTAALAVQHCSCQTVHFDCPKLPPLPPARTVYELRPQDIRVVMALGDSVTAGKELVIFVIN